MRNARNPSLEAPLQADPYDRDAWVVYGDWLQQQDDPRGEYIALRAAWLANPSDRAARANLDRCAHENDAYFRGPLTRGGLAWSFVDSTELTMWPLEVITASEARFLTSVDVSSSVDAAIAHLGPHLPVTIRKLSIGGDGPTTLDPIAPTLVRLQALTFRGPVRTELARYQFPALQTLDFDYARDNKDYVPRELLQQPLPSLIKLRLSLVGIDAALVRTIANAPYAKQLTSLWLFFLDDVAGKVLLDNLGKFPALSELKVDDARLSAEMLTTMSTIPGFGQSRVGGFDYND